MYNAFFAVITFATKPSHKHEKAIELFVNKLFFVAAHNSFHTVSECGVLTAAVVCGAGVGEAGRQQLLLVVVNAARLVVDVVVIRPFTCSCSTWIIHLHSQRNARIPDS